MPKKPTLAPSRRSCVAGLVLALAVASVALSIVVRRTRFGLALQGIGADEQRAQTLGVPTRWVKTAGFAITAGTARATREQPVLYWY